MAEVKVNALMLRAVDYRENDKILTLLSAERGRITAGIKGVKKANAKLKFAAQPFCFAEYILAERGGRYTVTQASECESFYELRCDVDKYYAACAVCEAALSLTTEGDGGGEIFALCVKALRDMCVSDHSNVLISFLLGALKACGYGLSLSQFCPICGNRLEGCEKLRFDFHSGSFTCWDCSAYAGVSAQTFKALLIADGKKFGEADADGKKRALKLLREYIIHKLDARCVCLTDYINLI
ncbi:MAG: DNA repair protein RecO [Candidatus Coproplasma sp.]